MPKLSEGRKKLTDAQVHVLVELSEHGAATLHETRKSCSYFLRRGRGDRIAWLTVDNLLARGYVQCAGNGQILLPTPEGVEVVKERL